MPGISFRGLAGDFQRQRDIVEGGARRQQVEVLEDHPDRTPRLRNAPLVERADIAPSTRTRPVVGCSRPLTSRIRVDLPAPVRPITPTIAPSGTRRVDVVDRDHLRRIGARRKYLGDAVEGNDGTLLRIDRPHGRSWSVWGNGAFMKCCILSARRDASGRLVAAQITDFAPYFNCILEKTKSVSFRVLKRHRESPKGRSSRYYSPPGRRPRDDTSPSAARSGDVRSP